LEGEHYFLHVRQKTDERSETGLKSLLPYTTYRELDFLAFFIPRTCWSRLD
jgi:hypothetical protein